MMGHFITSKLLLMTLLLQPSENAEQETHTTPEPDDSVRFGEFCLRISDDSHWTSPKSVTQQPTKSAHTTQLLEQPTTEPTHQTDPKVLEPLDLEIPKYENIHFVMTDPSELVSPIIEDGCRCQEREGELPADTSQFKSIFTRFPSESCDSTETIVTLMDNREVCVAVPSPLAYYDEFLRHRSEPVIKASSHEELLVSFPAPLEPTTELPITTLPPETETEQFYDPDPQTTLSSISEEEIHYPVALEDVDVPDGVFHICEFCNFNTSMDSIDLKAVQFLNVKIQPFPCPIHINVSLNNDTDFCLDSNQPEFGRMLKQLEIPPPDDDDFNPITKNITDGCRCKEGEQKPPTKVSDVKSTKIWRPTETCSLTEFIETLVDGREVCVTTPSLSEYLEFVFRTVTQPALSHKAELELESMMYEVPPSILEHRVKIEEAVLSKSLVEEPLYLCFACIPFGNWNDVDPKDVQSLEMYGEWINCPVLFFIHMRNRDVLCANGSEPGFRSLLEKLAI